ncbi:MAG: hypothetical protein GY862_33205 [Gammaproteobacteria bacterium]|nr:hypothetical protein [Gammaproteobacteria bacterium]
MRKEARADVPASIIPRGVSKSIPEEPAKTQTAAGICGKGSPLRSGMTGRMGHAQ